MATLTINFLAPTPLPYNGFIVKYRSIGSSTYTIVSPNPVASPVVINGITNGVGYEGTIKSDCGNQSSSPEISFVAYAYTQIYTLYGVDITATCNASTIPVYIPNNYTDIAPGISVYSDPGMTTLLTTPNYIMTNSGIIYPINDGVVGSGGVTCP